MGHPVERQALDDAGEPEAVIAVEMGDADPPESPRRHPGQQQLALGALAGVEEHAVAVPAQEVAVVVAMPRSGSGWRSRGRPAHARPSAS